ncbi:glycoside hydrolase family 3 protein [Polyporus arcularius HHB13444]|uniref:Glycoside hydrolase family 3 protein n=1 Tax=Polyporus arcularius HHB13444 TaxID=1314778 RepID=A0A5C3NN11_9APHY|nr:glycoside hydrolase family 3 protein [Polyporus arcularius HHB13444]
MPPSDFAKASISNVVEQLTTDEAILPALASGTRTLFLVSESLQSKSPTVPTVLAVTTSS